MREMFIPHAAGVKIIIASRYEETGLYQINNTQLIQSAMTKETKHYKKVSQLSFSFQ